METKINKIITFIVTPQILEDINKNKNHSYVSLILENLKQGNKVEIININ